MASDPSQRTRSSGHDSSSHTSEPRRLGLLTFDTTPHGPSGNGSSNREPSIGELTHALNSCGGLAARSPVLSEVDASEMSRGLSSSRSTESAPTPLSQAVAQYHASQDIRPRRGTEALDSHYFTLTVPPDKALAVFEAVKKIRDDLELGGSSLDWKHSKTQRAARQHRPGDQAARRKTTGSAVGEPPDSSAHPVSFKSKWGARIGKIQPLSLSYANVRVDEIVDHAVRTWWRGLANNLYHLPPAFYFIVFLGLTAWAFGSIVCGYYEAKARLNAQDISGAWPAFWRGTIGAIPALTGIITFLFPPTFSVRYR